MFAINPTCADPESTMTSNSVTLKSFEGLFAITGSVTATCLLVFLIFYLCKNKHLLQRIIANSSSTTWSRFCAVCRHFDQRDLSSYPFSRSQDTTQDDKFQQLHNININMAAAAASSSSHSSVDSVTSSSHLPDVEMEMKDANHEIIQPNVVV